MPSELVDLSLFTVSPTNDNLFSLDDEGTTHSALGQASRGDSQFTPPRPLPPITNRRLQALELDTSQPRSSTPGRRVLERVRRLRVDPSGSSESSRPRPHPPRRQPTLQERRSNNPSTPTLTIPTLSHDASNRAPSSAAPSSQARPAAPMIWLADEEMWLVADAVDSTNSQADLYGYYAPAPRTDPGPWEAYPADRYEDVGGFEEFDDEAPPAYTPSPASDPSQADFSPVRTQFSNLLAANSGVEHHRPGSQSRDVPQIRDDRTALSPMFQEAISGVGFGVSAVGVGPGSIRRQSRRESWHSNSTVSPLSSSNTDTPITTRITRATSMRN